MYILEYLKFEYKISYLHIDIIQIVEKVCSEDKMLR